MVARSLQLLETLNPTPLTPGVSTEIMSVASHDLGFGGLVFGV